MIREFALVVTLLAWSLSNDQRDRVDMDLRRTREDGHAAGRGLSAAASDRGDDAGTRLEARHRILAISQKCVVGIHAFRRWLQAPKSNG